MNTKTYGIIIGLLILLAIGGFIFLNRTTEETTVQQQQPMPADPIQETSLESDTQALRTFESVQQEPPVIADGGKPEGWQSYNYSTSGTLQPVSFYIPPLGEYCNGCIDGGGIKGNSDTVQITISGGNDTPQVGNPKWRLYLYDAPVSAQTTLNEQTEQVYEVDLGERKVTFAFIAYDPAFEGLFDAIQQSIIFEHRPDAELP